MDYRDAVRHFFYQKKIELFITILVIGILAVAAIKIYSGCRERAHVMAGVCEAFDSIRHDASVYYALNGQWPESTKGLKAFTARLWDMQETAYSDDFENSVERIWIENAGIHIRLKQPVGLQGKTASIRPAVPEKDLPGVVIWVCGSRRNSEGWKISGEDKTDISNRLIVPALR